MPDLSTAYLGLDLRSPIVASAGPLTRTVETMVALEDHGVGAVVLPSLFEEQIVLEAQSIHATLEAGTDMFGEAGDYFPPLPSYDVGPDRYLTRVEEAKAKLEVPVIASLNASSIGGWVRYAKLLEQAGADALELNIYEVHVDPHRSSAEVEDADVELAGTVASMLEIPVAVKLSPYYSAFASFAVRLAGSGIAGLVLFNRFYQPDLDLETLDVLPSVELSSPWELRLPLRWIAVLREQLTCSLAATSGVHGGQDVAKALLVGADVAMTTSALLHHGPAHIETMEEELVSWMVDNEYTSVDQLRGSVRREAAANPEAFERSNYARTLSSWR
jgi:dihydroorotate dehydrogenase (fumarate)